MFQVDWRKPWVRDFQLIGESLLAQWQYLEDDPAKKDKEAQEVMSESLHVILNAEKATRSLLSDFVFVGQSQKPQHVSYEEHIFDTHQIPTRDNAHDFFNALAWFTCPLTKQALNHLQAEHIKKLGVGETRGRLRDALTLFDENVMLIQCGDALWSAMCERDWLKLFWELRREWSSVQTLVFGHALQEKLLVPYKAITAHVLRVNSSIRPKAWETTSAFHPWDAWMAECVLDLPRRLEPHDAPKPFQVMPVLGIPDWHPENAKIAFYEDPSVFRIKR